MTKSKKKRESFTRLNIHERTVIGHWQGDTVVSRKSVSRVKSINEVTSGVVFFEKTEDGTATVCNSAVIRYCSYERGANENANGLLRRLFPKGTDFGKVSAEDIARVEYLINTRPRKRLGGLTPYEVFYQKTGVDLESMAYSKLTSGAIES